MQVAAIASGHLEPIRLAEGQVLKEALRGLRGGGRRLGSLRAPATWDRGEQH